MVPLREILTAFDYTFAWNHDTKVSSIYYNNTLAATIDVINGLYTNGKSSITLESPPKIVAGKTYIPLSFFSYVVPIAHSTMRDGSIVFSIYNG